MGIPTFKRNYNKKSKSGQRKPGDLQTGEIVDIILLDYDVPKFAKLEHPDEELSYFDYGLEWRVAVVRRGGEFKKKQPNQTVFNDIDDKIEIPDYIALSSITVWAPLEHSRRTTKTGKHIGNWIREGGGDEYLNNHPKIVDLFPSVEPEKYDKQEQKRILEWTKFINWWGKQKDNAFDILNNYLARKYLIYNRTAKPSNGDIVEYLDLKKGMTFRASISRSPQREDSQYFDIRSFSFLKKDEQGKYYRDFYCIGGNQSGEAGVIYADSIIEAYNEKKRLWEEKREYDKMKKEGKLESTEEDNEEVEEPW